MNLRNLLMRTYPRSWRAEYGPELEGILAQKPLTPAVVLDVLAGGVRQHLRDPWKACALALAIWTAGLLFGLARLVSRPVFPWLYLAGRLFMFAAGTGTVVRRRSGIWRATFLAVKAALLSDVATFLCSTLITLRYGAFFVRGHSLYYWNTRTMLISLLIAAIFGWLGALAGSLAVRFSARLTRG